MAFILNRRARDARESRSADQSQDVQKLVSAADVARDNRRWGDAARLYRQYLALRADDAPIWVQLGHALKESGNLSEAEAAYKKSLALAPDVADTQLQLGHLYKKMRNFSDAISAYREAARIDDMLVDARLELAEFGIGTDDLPVSQRSAAPRRPSMFIDLSDVFFYLRHHQTVSGIQRVQLGIATALIAMSAKERSGILFLSEANNRHSYVVIDDVFVSEIARELSRDEVAHARLITIMNSATSRARLYDPVAGDTLLILGAFWVLQNIAERIISLKRQGVRVGTLIHDIIPITHPEFCEKSLTDEFRAYFFSVLSVADFILTISDHSGRCVEDFIVKNGIARAPIRTLNPAHKTWEPPSQVTAALSPAVSRLIKEEYVMYVSTIEIRKNHTYLFRIWKRLLEELRTKTPKLVFVGRPGWRVADLMDQLRSTNNLDGHIRILHDLSDAELAALYQSALFTVFPSYEEGWGLPVGESLVFGRPCVASNSSSVPEVAGDLVDYVDPYNHNDGYQKIRRFIKDRDYLKQRARDIQENFEARDWHDVAFDMIEIVHSLVDEWGAECKAIAPPRAEPGHMYRLGHRDDISGFIASGDSAFVHFACDTSWDAVENFGRWMRGRNAAIEFATQKSEDKPILLMLEIFTVAWLDKMQLQLTINGTTYPLVKLAAGARRFLLLHVTPESGRVTVEFSAEGEIATGLDPRQYLWFGLGSVGYAPKADALARVMLLEDVMAGMSNMITLQPTHVTYRSDTRRPPAREQDDESESPKGPEEPEEPVAAQMG
jgi:glycosyltransferase involved in cell wall biosynthesis